MNHDYAKLYLEELEKVECNFTSTRNFPSSTKTERCMKARAQEEIFMKLLPTTDKFGNRYTVLHIEDYCNVFGITDYKHLTESSKGDFVVMHDGKEILRIDLKVGLDKYVGTPEMISLFNFGWDHNSPNYYYCCRIDGSCKRVFKANELLGMVLDGRANVIVSYHRTNLSERINRLRDKVKLFMPKKLVSADTTKLYDEDFVNSGFVEKQFSNNRYLK